MNQSWKMTCIVVAGGLGTRLGGNKLSLSIGDQTLLERVLRRVSPLSDETLLVIAEGQDPPLPPDAILRRVYDIYPGKGALGGLHAGLKASVSSLNLAVAGDMPFLHAGLLQHMQTLSEGVDAVVPRVEGKVHPLHALYHKRCLNQIEAQIKEGEYRVTNLLDRLKVRYLETEVVNQFDPSHLSFFNVNTEDDLRRARRLAAEAAAGEG
jgi:molybdopterin-guanine dinucleotide biosynthesis protein A